MIRKLIRQMLAAQTLSALTVSLCLLIDNIMIGRFLGVQAIAAYGLANPVLLIIGAIASLLAAGVQVACSKSLGTGSKEETARGYSSALALGMALSLVFVLLVLLLRGPLATLMGAGTQGELSDQTRDYLGGFILGAPATMGALVLVPFLQMAGKSSLLIVAVLGMTVSDVAFDLLNVLVLHGGMFGMGLASSLSYYVALIIALLYFLSSRCVFTFSFRSVSLGKIRELLTGGVPSLFSMASSVMLVFVLNKMLLGAGGSEAVAAFGFISMPVFMIKLFSSFIYNPKLVAISLDWRERRMDAYRRRNRKILGLIAVLTALRYVLRGRIALRLQYALWALALFRLKSHFHSVYTSLNGYYSDFRKSYSSLILRSPSH